MGKTLQDQITSLNDSLDDYTDSGRFTFRRWYLQNAGSMTLTFSGGSQGIFLISGSTAAKTTIARVYVASNGGVDIVDLINPSIKVYSFTTSVANKLTITTSQVGVTLGYIHLGGQLPT
jgi:hypothetical protein